MLVAYNNLKNAVYSGLFKVEIKTSNFTVRDFSNMRYFLANVHVIWVLVFVHIGQRYNKTSVYFRLISFQKLYTASTIKDTIPRPSDAVQGGGTILNQSMNQPTCNKNNTLNISLVVVHFLPLFDRTDDETFRGVQTELYHGAERSVH